MSGSRKFSYAIDLLANIDREIQLTLVQTFLQIAKKEGCSVRDVYTAVGLTQSAVARQLALLGDQPSRSKKDGLRLVEVKPDPADPRRGLCFLTPKGRKLINDLDDALT